MLKKLTPEPLNRWFEEQYGSRRGFVLTWWHRLLYRLGRYRNYRQVNWAEIDRLVFVCKGNICRSAFAEVVARTDGQTAVSCGIEAGVDVPAYEGAVTAAESRGFSLAEHRTTPLHNLELRDNDLLVAMEPWQARYLTQTLGGGRPCTLLGLWGSTRMPYIHDPYSASAHYFDNCFSYLEHAVYEIDRKIAEAARR
jgi:protein-tyrosine phosphatase